jgi:hypothetical protein
LAVSGPFGAVKEQVSGLYAQTMAERGFVTLALDPSYTGESSGEPRNTASPDIEDFSAAVDFLGLHASVDRNRIGVLGICGFSGMALTAATGDSRIRAIATVSMYDMSRSMSRSHRDNYTKEQRREVIDYLSEQRWADAEAGRYAVGLHEVPLTTRETSSRAIAFFLKRCPTSQTRCWLRSSTTTGRRGVSMQGASTRRPRGRRRRRCRSSASRCTPTSR